MKQKFLTVNEAAAFVGLSRTAIYSAIAAKRLPRLYSGGNLVIRESDLKAWKKSKAQPGPRKGSLKTAEHKAAIAAAQRQRWQNRKRTN